MPTYRITGPDGKTYQVTAPDGATESQVLAYVQAQTAPKSPEEIAAAEEARLRELIPGVTTNPTDGTTGLQRFGAGAGKSLRDTGLGTVQALSEGGPMTSGPLWLAKQFGVEMPANPVKEWADSAIAENRDADVALTDTPGGFWGNVAGMGAQVLGPGIVAGMATRTPALAPGLKATAARALPALLPKTVAGGSTQGGLLGAIQPVQEGESREANTGLGLLGGFAGSLAPRLIGATVRGANRVIEPFREAGLENIVGRTLQRFASNPQIAPLADPILGKAPTLAEATLDPGIAQLQRAAASKSPGVANALFDSRVAANEGRANALERFAGTPAARQTAIDGITAAEDAAYASVRQAGGVNVRPVIDQIDAILMGPEGKRSAVRSALNEARRSLFMDADSAVAETSADRLLGARGAINDLLAGGGENQAGKLAQRQLIAIKESLDAAIAKQAPELTTALDARRVGMKPVNEMDTITALLQKATVPVPTRTGGMGRSLQPSAFLRPTEDLDKLARQGTGFRKAEADNVLSPQAQEAIEGVRVGLARQQFADSAGKVAGSPTAQFLAGQNIMDAVGGKPGGLLQGVMDSVAAGLDKPYMFMGVPQRLEAVMARVLSNPAEAQTILSRLPAPDRALLEQAIGRGSASLGAGAGMGLGTQ